MLAHGRDRVFVNWLLDHELPTSLGHDEGDTSRLRNLQRMCSVTLTEEEIVKGGSLRDHSPGRLGLRGTHTVETTLEKGVVMCGA